MLTTATYTADELADLRTITIEGVLDAVDLLDDGSEGLADLAEWIGKLAHRQRLLDLLGRPGDHTWEEARRHGRPGPPGPAESRRTASNG